MRRARSQRGGDPQQGNTTPTPARPAPPPPRGSGLERHRRANTTRRPSPRAGDRVPPPGRPEHRGAGPAGERRISRGAQGLLRFVGALQTALGGLGGRVLPHVADDHAAPVRVRREWRAERQVFVVIVPDVRAGDARLAALAVGLGEPGWAGCLTSLGHRRLARLTAAGHLAGTGARGGAPRAARPGSSCPASSTGRPRRPARSHTRAAAPRQRRARGSP
jgi:hypothetical protein